MNAQVFSRHINLNNITSPSAFSLDESPKDKLKEYNFNLLFGLVELDIPKGNSDDFTAISYFDGTTIKFLKLKPVDIRYSASLGSILKSEIKFNLTNIDNLFAGTAFLRKTEFPASKGKCWMIFGGCYSAKSNYILEPETLYDFNTSGVTKVKNIEETGECIDSIFKLPIWGADNSFSIQSTMQIKHQKSMFKLHKRLTNPNITPDGVRKLCDDLNICHSLGVHPDQNYYTYISEMNKLDLIVPSWKMLDKENLKKIEVASNNIISLLVA